MHMQHMQRRRAPCWRHGAAAARHSRRRWRAAGRPRAPENSSGCHAASVLIPVKAFRAEAARGLAVSVKGAAGAVLDGALCGCRAGREHGCPAGSPRLLPLRYRSLPQSLPRSLPAPVRRGRARPSAAGPPRSPGSCSRWEAGGGGKARREALLASRAAGCAGEEQSTCPCPPPGSHRSASNWHQVHPCTRHGTHAPVARSAPK